jgi:DNA-binding transcriptional LysR family regulator
MVFLPRLLEYLGVRAPPASVRAVNLRPDALARALEEGSVDLAVGYFPDVKGGNYFQQRLFSHGFVCLARADHPVVGKQLTRAGFLSLEHAVVQAEGRSQEVFEQYLRKHRIERRVVLNVPHFMSIPLVIAKSDLIATVPLAVGTSFAKFTPLKLVKPPFELPRFDLKQHWHRRFHKDARNVWLRSVIASLFNESQDEWREARQ